MRSPQNASVLITGAGRGIGKRLAIGFAQSGAKVGLFGRSQGELDATKIEVENTGGTALRFRGDICRFDEIVAAVDRMTAAWGEVHALIANAGVQGPIGPFAQQKPDRWMEVFETSLVGVFNSCRAVLPQMIQRRRGKIVVISGDGASAPRPRFAAYAASQAALARFVETLAEEVRDHNVQVNSLYPGGTYTSMTDEILAAGMNAGPDEIERAERVRMSGGVPPDKQIQLAQFLISERSNHVTGKLIGVQDDWKKLENENIRQDAYTLRRHLK